MIASPNYLTHDGGAATLSQHTDAAARQGASAGKVVVVHSGARDRYQVALGLSQAGLLQCLVTDFFWSEDTPFRQWLARHLSARVLSVLRQRSAPGLPSSRLTVGTVVRKVKVRPSSSERKSLLLVFARMELWSGPGVCSRRRRRG